MRPALQVVVAALASTGCVAMRSPELACKASSDCTDGRSCEQGFCVVTDTDGGASDDADSSDGGTDADVFVCSALVGHHFAGCDIPQPTRSLVLDAAGTYTYDTDLAILIAPNSDVTQPEHVTVTAGRVISIQQLMIGSAATLRVVGAKPLIIASWSTISVAGTIDASSTATKLGAGANPAACASHAATAGGNDTAGAGGGGGAGMRGAGGKGGGGDGDNNGGPAGAAVTMTPSMLAGGCAGARGGTGNANGGAGGNGGGAIQLTALESITIDGSIHVGGAGGGGGTGDNGGGGGGGSGGMIGLESASITLGTTSMLAANGGGGGGGAGDVPATGGQDARMSAVRAPPGPGSDGGSSGGLGGAGTATAGDPGINDNDRGGGGGGGGTGFVVVSSTMPATMGGVASPAATLMPR
ncbi:MAG TPA: hypothetical protein VIU61_26750 [Kofleriaceae bacterium]